MERGQEALAAARTALVHRDPTDLHVTGLGADPLHVMLQHASDPAIGDAQQAGHDPRRHLPSQGNNEHLHRQREAGALAAPRHLELAGLDALAHATRGNSAWI